MLLPPVLAPLVPKFIGVWPALRLSFSSNGDRRLFISMARLSAGCGRGEGEWAGECGPELIRATKDGASAVDLIMIPSRLLSRVSIGMGTAGRSVFGETVSPFIGSSSEMLGRCMTAFWSSFEKTLVTGAVTSGPSQMGVVILSFSCDGCLELDALLVTLGPEKEP